MPYTAATPTVLEVRFDLAYPLPSVNPYSARGLRGALTPIAAASGDDKLARTVNGTLINLSAPQMRKYRLEVSGEDQAPPALDGLWVGMVVNVDCHVEVAFRATSYGSHPQVPDSQRVEGDYAYYRPRMIMMVVEWQIEREEWGANVPWSLVLEEV